MNAAEVLIAVREAGASLRVEGDYLVASNANRIAPEIKAAIRANKPQLIAALKPTAPSAETNDGGRVKVIELPLAPRYRKVFAHLQLKPPALVPIDRWQQCVKDGRRFLMAWGELAEALGWTSADLFGLHTPPDKPHPTYSRLSRYDETGLIWLLEGREVMALTEATATIKNSSDTGAITTYRRFNKPALGPIGDSLDDSWRSQSTPDAGGAARGRYRVSCTTRMPCRSVIRAFGQRATAAR